VAEPGEPGGDPLDFSGRVVVVTGGARGVGRGIAEAFLGVGAEVMVCGRTMPPEDELPRSGGAVASFVPADVRDAEQVAALVATAVERHGRLDVLVNNAGGSPEVAAAEASPRFVAAIVGLNLLGPMYCAQAANAVMQGQDSGGSIVNIGSLSGVRPSPGTAAYGAAKAGLLNATKSLAMEWAPKVRVNCVVAGLIATEAAHDFYGGAEAIKAVAETVPLRRMGTPADIAGVCLFLASSLAGFVTGAAVEAHGGGEWPPFKAAARGIDHD